MEYLKGSIFDRDFMQTKIKTNRITTKERVLGHMLGPGFVYVYYCVVLGLRELFYMDVMRINEVFQNAYTYLVLTTVTTLLGIATGFFINHMTERTVCRAGRFRPYVLIGIWVMAISGFFMFWAPFQYGTTLHLVWLYIFNFIYNCVGLPMYALRFSMISVTSRNILERNNVTTIRSAITVMIAGIVVSLGIVGTLYPMILQKDLSGKSWFITIGATAVIAMIFSIIEYFWTRERVTEENQKVLADKDGDATVHVPLLQQMKNAITNKYFLLALVVSFGVAFYDNLQGGNARVNMITYILGGNDENGLQLIYLMASMQPMAIGAIVVPILSKKFSARKIMMISSVITVVGIVIALTQPDNFVVAVAGGFIFAAGIFAVTNMNTIFMQQASDDIEYKYGYRPEGTLAVGILTTLITAILTPLNAAYETGLSVLGYQAPVADAATGLTQIIYDQPSAVKTWILFAYYGAYAVLAVVVFVVCIFFDAEKHMPKIHEELRNRAKKAAEDRGEVWISPEEQDRLEMEKAAKELEQSRIEELKELCAKKGLDFDVENRKYLDKEAAKAAKRERKRGKK